VDPNKHHTGIVSGGAREQTTSTFKTMKVSFSDLIPV